MSFKRLGSTLLFITTALLGCDSMAAIDTDSLSQCQQVAELTPAYIYENTQKGATEELNTLARSCFTQNACAFMTDINKPSCARSLALNSYLINVAYRTQKQAQPPYASISAILAADSSSNNSDAALTATDSNTEQNTEDETQTDTAQWWS